MAVPAFLPYYVLILSLGIILAIATVLRRSLDAAGWRHAERVKAFWVVFAILAGWFLLALALAVGGAYRASPTRSPTIQYGLLAPLLIGWLLIWRSQRLSEILEAVPQHWLIGIQLYRVLGVVFLILYASNRLPGVFALPAGIGDVLIGLSAPIVASMALARPQGAAPLIRVWNVLGILDLVIAVAMGFLISPSPLQVWALDRPNEMISAFPLVLIPTYLVSLSVLLHTISLIKVRQSSQSGKTRAVA